MCVSNKSKLTNQIMEIPSPPSRITFLHDKDKRMQNLYYDIDIRSTYNKTKLRNVKRKYWKYAKFLSDIYIERVQRLVWEFGCIRDNAFCDWQKAKRISLNNIHNPTTEIEGNRNHKYYVYREADDEFESMRIEEQLYDQVISLVQDKIKDISKHLKDIRFYKLCAHCETMNNVTISGCKSKHKLCYDCIYNKKECPVCEEDMGLLHCDICYRYKKELVNTGCKNKHQTCKVCLGKIKRKNNLCPFCRETCSKNQPAVVPIYVEGTQHTVEEMEEMDESYFASSRIMSYR